MSVFHRVEPDDVETLTAQQFWPRVRRLMHYDGVVRAVALAEVREQQAVPVEQLGAQPESGVLTDPTPEQIKALRDAARRRRYPAAQFGDVRYVSDQEIVRKAGTSA